MDCHANFCKICPQWQHITQFYKAFSHLVKIKKQRRFTPYKTKPHKKNICTSQSPAKSTFVPQKTKKPKVQSQKKPSTKPTHKGSFVRLENALCKRHKRIYAWLHTFATFFTMRGDFIKAQRIAFWGDEFHLAALFTNGDKGFWAYHFCSLNLRHYGVMPQCESL